jgi:photosystem II stability/assembly factor-like uncharacterized protein
MPLCSYAQDWQEINRLPQGDNLNGLTYLESLGRLLAVGDAGLVIYSDDDGNSWTEQHLPEMPYMPLEGVEFPSDNIGYAAGGTGFVYKSENGGQTWSLQQANSTEWIISLSFISVDTGCYLTNQGKVYRTENGGQVWFHAGTVPPTSSFRSIEMINSNEAFVGVSNLGGMYRTADGGATWVTAWIGTSASINGIHFPSSQVGYAVGTSDFTASIDLVLKTTNAGLLWTEVRNNAGSPHLEDVMFLNDDEGFAITGGSILKTIDGGVNWDQTIIGGYSALAQIVDGGASGLWIAGEEHVLYNSIDQGQNWIDQNAVGTLVTYYSCWFLDDSVGYVGTGATGAGSSEVHSTDDGGVTWNVHTLPSFQSRVYAIQVIDDSVIYALTWLNMLKSVDAGATWIELDPPESYYDMHFLNDSIGYAVGNNERMARTLNGGATWTDLTIDVGDFRGVHFVNDSTGYAVGDWSASSNALIAKTEDYGATWDTTHVGVPGSDLQDVQFINDSVGVAVGYNGLISRTFDAGQSWDVKYYGYWLFSVDCPADSVWYTVGQYGRILKSTDQGDSWQSQASGVGRSLRDVFFLNKDTGYAVGTDGVIIKTTIGGVNVCPEAVIGFNGPYILPDSTVDFFHMYYGVYIDGNTTWEWDFGNSLTSNNVSPSTTYTDSGTYIVTLIVSNGNCSDTAYAIVYVYDYTSVDEFERGIKLKAYPSPATDQVTFEIVDGRFQSGVLLLHDLEGRIMVNQLVTGKDGRVTIDTRSLSSGTYFYSFIVDSEVRYSDKLIIVH